MSFTSSHALRIEPLESHAQQRAGFTLFRQAQMVVPDLEQLAPGVLARYLDPSWMLGASEGAELLGVTNGYDTRITLPGGAQVRHLSVTHVGVAAPATRRGIARRLLTRQLQLARDAGYIAAGLRASNASLYGRYGYGVASWTVRHELDMSRAGGLIAPAAHTQVRQIDTNTSFPLLQSIANAAPAGRPANLNRWDGWWAMQEFRSQRSATPSHTAVFGKPGAERGFVRFHAESADNWLMSTRRSIIVDDLFAHDDEAWRALIGYLFAKDIVHRAVFPSRPVDDPLPLLLRDSRALDISLLRDESWIRPLDLPALLAARRYGDAPAVVLAVEDDLFPDNAGPWRISPDGVSRTAERAHAHITVSDLASLIFGAQSARNLVSAARLREAPEQAIEHLDRLFITDRKPHSGMMF